MVLSLLPLAAIEGGGYVSAWKAIPVVLILLFWMKMLTWVDKDAEAAFLPRDPINSGMMGGALLAFALFFLLPNYWLCLGVLILILGAEIGTYLGIRHKRVGLADLKDSLRASFTPKGKRKEHKAVAGEVALIDKKGTVVTPPTAEDPQAPGFIAVQTFLSDALVRGAERIDMAPAEGVAQVRYHVDGMPYNGQSMDVASSQAGVAYLKQLAGLDLNERRKPQKGKMKVAVGATRHELELTTAGSTTGEFLRVMVDPKKRHAFQLPDLGFSDDQMTKMRALTQDVGGLVLVAAPKGQGLTSTMYGIIRAHDAFLQHIHSIERGIEEDLEGITQTDIKAGATAEDEHAKVDWIVSQEPDVIMLTSIESPKTAQALIRLAGEGKRVYIGLRAGSTFQALDQWRKLVGDDNAAMKNLRMIISGRVMRRLCNACKVGYSPDPDTVRKLNLDPARVNKLFMPRKEPMRDPKGNPIPCEFCKELRYKGRFGVFEILDVDDDVRQIVTSGGSVNQLKAIFRKQRNRFLQEQALVQVSEGETSVQEMLRVLRSDEAAGGGGGGGGAQARAAARPPAKPPAR